MRRVLVDWLISLHLEFEIASEISLFLTINVLDRYLALEPIQKDFF